jgi:hypothetical protein
MDNSAKERGTWSLVLSVATIVSSWLVQLKSLREALPLPLILGWLLVLVIALCVAIWSLCVSPSPGIILDPSKQGGVGLKWPLVASLVAVLVLSIGAFQVASTLHPSVALPEPVVSHPSNKTTAVTLRELYKEVNSDILQAVSDPLKRFIAITAAGGAGKSFFLGRLEERFPKAQVVHLCRKAGGTNLCQDVPGIHYVSKPELVFGPDPKDHFNTMSAIETFSADTFFAPFAPFANGGVVLLDDLDEIHPDSVVTLLKVMATYISSKNHTLQFVVFTRPEALHDFMTSPESNDGTQMLTILPLKSPSYDTEREVDALVDDWGRFKFQRSADTIKKVQSALFKYSQEHEWLRASMQNLSLANYICEQFERNVNWSESELKDRIVSELFNRAYKSHGRPQIGDSVYKNLVLKVAADEASHVISTGDQAGYFPVLNTPIPLEGSTQLKGEVMETNLLRLSGIAVLKPEHWESEYWAFTPAWLHRYFVEQYNRTARPEYWGIYACVLVLIPFTPLVVFCYALRRRRALRYTSLSEEFPYIQTLLARVPRKLIRFRK